MSIWWGFLRFVQLQLIWKSHPHVELYIGPVRMPWKEWAYRDVTRCAKINTRRRKADELRKKQQNLWSKSERVLKNIKRANKKKTDEKKKNTHHNKKKTKKEEKKIPEGGRRKRQFWGEMKTDRPNGGKVSVMPFFMWVVVS